jgi:hypothetical protein
MDYLKKKPNKTKQALEQFSRQVASDLQSLSMNILALARVCKITPEEFVKVLRETGANHAFIQNCQLVEKRLDEEAKEEAERTKEAIETLAIK